MEIKQPIMWLIFPRIQDESVGVFFNQNWVTPTVERLALEICKMYSWSVLPILANALQDADCNEELILNVLRTDPSEVNIQLVLTILQAIIGVGNKELRRLRLVI